MFKDFNNVEYMVMEYVSGGNLKDLLNSKRDILCFNELMDMIISAATGMQYLERCYFFLMLFLTVFSKKIIHRDLAARNLLVRLGSDGRYEVKVSDFGLGKCYLCKMLILNSETIGILSRNEPSFANSLVKS
jgi:serine/threonine protein kinase